MEIVKESEREREKERGRKISLREKYLDLCVSSKYLDSSLLIHESLPEFLEQCTLLSIFKVF